MEAPELRKSIEQSGFESIGELDPQLLVARYEVRDMCASGKCHAYGHNWACPPALPGIEVSNAEFKRFHTGFVFQTIALMEDDFDYEAIQAASKEHGRRFNRLLRLLADRRSELMLLSAGTCRVCKECTYPDAPCRHPERAYPSMEAKGLIVADTCTLAGVPYNHGPQTLAFSSCALC